VPGSGFAYYLEKVKAAVNAQAALINAITSAVGRTSPKLR
jgi:hypothetical protein